MYYCGWDGGGTKTGVCLLDGAGRVLGEAAFGPLNPNDASRETVLQTVGEAISYMKKQPGGLAACGGLVIGAAGISNARVAALLSGAVADCGYTGKLRLLGDQEIALAAVRAGKPYGCEKPVTMDAAEARTLAEKFLSDNGFDDLTPERSGENGALASFWYVPSQDGAPRVEDGVSISVALDDGSIYAFDATRYDPAPAELSWKIGEDEALNTLPDSVAAESSRRVICRSPGGNPLPCWEIRCTGLKGEPVTIYVNAETGRPCKIEL